MKKPWHLAVLVIALAVGPGAVMAQPSVPQSVLNRIDRLERDLQTLQVRLFRNGDQQTRASQTDSEEGQQSFSTDAATRLNNRLNTLENNVQRLTGKVERLGFQTRQMRKRLDQLVADLDLRLMALEEKAGLATPGRKSSATKGQAQTQRQTEEAQPGGGETAAQQGEAEETVNGVASESLYEKSRRNQQFLELPDTSKESQAEQPTKAKDQAEPPSSQLPLPGDPTGQTTPPDGGPVELPEGTPRQQYDYAFGLLQSGDFSRAEGALRKFLSAHPDHSLTANAQYWLAETYYVREMFNKAAVEFLKGYQRYPEAAKAPDNLLKLALSLSEIGSHKEACTTLDKLAKDFPKAPITIRRRGAAEWERLDCRSSLKKPSVDE